MNDRAIEIIRTCLMVVGILLLVIFGSRAAAQARNMKLAGATHKSVLSVGNDIMAVLGFGKTEAGKTYQPSPIYVNVPAEMQTATPIDTSSTSGTAAPSQSPQSTVNVSQASNNGLHKAVGTVNNATTNTQQVVNNVTKNTTDDFTNLWP